MKTIFIYENEGYVKIIVILVGFILFSLILFFYCFPILRESIKIIRAFLTDTLKVNYKNWETFDIVKTLFFSLIVFVVSCSTLFGSIHLLLLNEIDHVDAKIDQCLSVSGQIVDFSCEEVLLHHGQVVNYECSFSIDGISFNDIYIKADQKNVVEYLKTSRQFTVYYQTKDNKNLIAQIDMQLPEYDS